MKLFVLHARDREKAKYMLHYLRLDDCRHECIIVTPGDRWELRSYMPNDPKLLHLYQCAASVGEDSTKACREQHDQEREAIRQHREKYCHAN